MDSENRHRALTELLDAHGTRIYATLVRLTLRNGVAADLLQELFLRLGDSDGFDQANDQAAYAWRTAINLAMEWRRRQRRDLLAPGSPLADCDIVSSEPSPLERLVRAEQYERLLDHVNDLSELAREAFLLRFTEEQSYDFIAGRLGKTPHQVRGICHAAVRQLRDAISDADCDRAKMSAERAGSLQEPRTK